MCKISWRNAEKLLPCFPIFLLGRIRLLSPGTCCTKALPTHFSLRVIPLLLPHFYCNNTQMLQQYLGPLFLCTIQINKEGIRTLLKGPRSFQGLNLIFLSAHKKLGAHVLSIMKKRKLKIHFGLSWYGKWKDMARGFWDRISLWFNRLLPTRIIQSKCIDIYKDNQLSVIIPISHTN